MHLPRISSLLLLLGALSGNAAAQTQTIGPWTISAPDSATLVSGGGPNFTALNVANAALTVNDAFSGLPLDDDGYANAESSTTVEVVFLSGVKNLAGDDVVMFEAQYDNGTYTISSDYDGFAATVAVDTAGATLGSSKSYYYQGAGPYPASVVGVAVDLSSLGVPSGATVTKLRFTTTNSACDPIGMGALNSGPTLTVTPLPLIAGAPVSLSVTDGTPLGKIGFAYSKTGPGPVSVMIGTCGFVTLSMSAPIKLITIKTAGAGGSATVSGTLPAGLSGSTLFMQAVDVGSCTPTNMVVAPVI